jgi:D-sedoheptulose 7-phosphate isomerase
MQTWKKQIDEFHDLLEKLSVRDGAGNAITPDKGFFNWKEFSSSIRLEGKSIYFVGNGASASMASHFSTDIAKNGGIKTQVFTDVSLLTALSNDLNYAEVFAEPLRWWMQKGDMLVAISSSGNSPNVVQAVNVAKNLGGIVITISAMSKNNLIRKIGDLNFYVAAKTYGFAESAHAAILHHWMDLVEMNWKNEKNNL